jgi:hypothetical protein
VTSLPARAKSGYRSVPDYLCWLKGADFSKTDLPALNIAGILPANRAAS